MAQLKEVIQQVELHSSQIGELQASITNLETKMEDRFTELEQKWDQRFEQLFQLMGKTPLPQPKTRASNSVYGVRQTSDPFTPINHQPQTSTTTPHLLHQPKLDFPSFDGTHQRYFTIHPIDDLQKVAVASLYLEGKADARYLDYQISKPQALWSELVEDICLRFEDISQGSTHSLTNSWTHELQTCASHPIPDIYGNYLLILTDKSAYVSLILLQDVVTNSKIQLGASNHVRDKGGTLLNLVRMTKVSVPSFAEFILLEVALLEVDFEASQTSGVVYDAVRNAQGPSISLGCSCGGQKCELAKTEPETLSMPTYYVRSLCIFYESKYYDCGIIVHRLQNYMLLPGVLYAVPIFCGSVSLFTRSSSTSAVICFCSWLQMIFHGNCGCAGNTVELTVDVSITPLQFGVNALVYNFHIYVRHKLDGGLICVICQHMYAMPFLLVSLEFQLGISYVENVDDFLVCLDYWHSLEGYIVLTFISGITAVGMSISSSTNSVLTTVKLFPTALVVAVSTSYDIESAIWAFVDFDTTFACSPGPIGFTLAGYIPVFTALPQYGVNDIGDSTCLPSSSIDSWGVIRDIVAWSDFHSSAAENFPQVQGIDRVIIFDNTSLGMCSHEEDKGGSLAYDLFFEHSSINVLNAYFMISCGLAHNLVIILHVPFGKLVQGATRKWISIPAFNLVACEINKWCRLDNRLGWEANHASALTLALRVALATALAELAISYCVHAFSSTTMSWESSSFDNSNFKWSYTLIGRLIGKIQFWQVIIRCIFYMPVNYYSCMGRYTLFMQKWNRLRFTALAIRIVLMVLQFLKAASHRIDCSPSVQVNSSEIDLVQSNTSFFLESASTDFIRVGIVGQWAAFVIIFYCKELHHLLCATVWDTLCFDPDILVSIVWLLCRTRGGFSMDLLYWLLFPVWLSLQQHGGTVLKSYVVDDSLGMEPNFKSTNVGVIASATILCLVDVLVLNSVAILSKLLSAERRCKNDASSSKCSIFTRACTFCLIQA